MNSTDQLLLFADFALKSTLVLALALVASRWWRGASAANRHLVWLAAFGVLLLAPCTRLLSPRWSWQPARVAAVAPLPAAESSVATTVLVPSVTAAAPFAPPPLPQGQSAWPVWLAPRNGWLLLWGAGVLALLARLTVGASRLWWWRRRSAPVPDRRLNGLCREIAAGYGLKRPVELRSLDNCRVPMTWGTLRPVVLLPPDALTWPEARLALVLRHELGHIVRRDSLSRLLAQGVAALYWFNPLIWIGARALRLTQEQACDDLVLNAGTSAEAYALELVAAARRLQGERRIVPAVAMAEPSTLGRRIEGIIGETCDRRPSARRTQSLASAGVVLALTGFALAQVRGETAVPVAAETHPPTRPAMTVGDPFEDKSEPTVAPAKATRIKAAQVAVESRFIEINESDLKDLDLNQFGTRILPAAGLGANLLGEIPPPPWIGKLDIPAVIQALAKKTGTELLSAPSLTIVSGNPAKVSVGQMLRFPRSYGPPEPTSLGTGTPYRKPQDFTSQTIGVELAVTPTVGADGETIGLALHPSVAEFKGFVEREAPGSGTFQPIFSVREAKTNVSIPSGATVVMGTLSRIPRVVKIGETVTTEEIIKGMHHVSDRQPTSLGTSDNTAQRALLVFVTAKVVGPARVVPVTTTATVSVPVALEARFIEVSDSAFNFRDFDFGRFGVASPPPADSGPPEADPHHWAGQLDVPAALRELTQRSGGEILNPPGVTVLSGHKIRINAGKEMRYAVTNGMSGYTTGEGGPDGGLTADPAQLFASRTVGDELWVTPTVAAGSHTIELRLTPRVTEFEGYVEYGGPNMPGGPSRQPIFSTREITTSIAVQDGATLVLGGLTREVRAGDNHLPNAIGTTANEGLGGPASAKGAVQGKRNLLIFITAKIAGPEQPPNPPVTASTP